MKPECRTRTVVSLCEAMREAQDWSALPILADALEEAGFDDQDKLAVMRTAGLDPVHAQRIVAVVYSEESTDAVRIIDEAAAEIGGYSYYGESEKSPIGYDGLMRAAKDYAEKDESVHMGTNESYKDVNWDQFWTAYTLVTGREPTWASPEWKGSNPFSCSC